jgi:hypothetical protein
MAWDVMGNSVKAYLIVAPFFVSLLAIIPDIKFVWHYCVWV